MTVRSSALSSSGWMNSMAAVRSAPSLIAILVTSIAAPWSSPGSNPRWLPPLSFMNVERLFLKALR